MKLLRSFLFALVTAALLLSCSDKDSAVDPGPCDVPELLQISGNAVDNNTWPDDPLSLEDYWIDGDTLFLDIAYGGGCECHSFQVLNYLYNCCNPDPDPAIRLFHDAGGDACEAWLQQDLKVNLKSFRKEGVNEVSFLLYVKENQNLRFVSLLYVYNLSMPE